MRAVTLAFTLCDRSQLRLVRPARCQARTPRQGLPSPLLLPTAELRLQAAALAATTLPLSAQSVTTLPATALPNKGGSLAAQTSPPGHTAKPPNTHTRALCSRQVEHTPAPPRASNSLPGELPPQAYPDPQSGQTGLGLHSIPALPATRQQPPRHTPEPHRAPAPSSGGSQSFPFSAALGLPSWRYVTWAYNPFSCGLGRQTLNAAALPLLTPLRPVTGVMRCLPTPVR